MFDYAPNCGTSTIVNVGNVSTSDIEERGSAVLAADAKTANGNLGSSHVSCDENPGHCGDGTAFPKYLCSASVNSREAAETL
jgi:hypothetical protein